jgi:signal peptidase I
MRTGNQEIPSIEMACGLAGEVVRNFGEVRLRVLGTSMVPSVLPGDMVSVRRASLDDISAGEIVMFARNKRLFVHRVVQRRLGGSAGRSGEPCLITRGDRLLQNDPPVSSLEFLGRVVSIERDNRKVELHAHGSNRMIVHLLQSSDRLTYLYLRLASFWRAIFLGRVKCQA